MRVLRRRLGLTQKELAYLVGYESDTQISHIENGSRTPQLAEVLVIELVFGIPAVTIFPEVRFAVSSRVRRRVTHVLNSLERSGAAPRRLSYKAAQLERVRASLRRQVRPEQSKTFREATKII